MKYLAVFILVTLSVALAVSAADIETEWKEYKVKFDKHYNAEQDAKHMKIYIEKKKTIDAHNAKFQAGEVSWEMGINQFTDMTAEEIRQSMGSLRP